MFSVNLLGRRSAWVVLLGLSSLSFVNGQKEENEHGLVMSEWAREPLVAAPVALDFDDQGRMYVTRTQRRSTASLDIRRLRYWVKSDLSFTSVEDRYGFYEEALATENSEQNAWLRDFNGDGVSDFKDLTAVPDSVFYLEDTNGDGSADNYGLVDDQINSEVSGIAAGVMHNDGLLYVTAEPDVYLYSDSDDDGVPDARTLIGTGFQVHIGQGGHNMSGLIYGPDGRVYWSIADKGFNTKTKEGNHYYYPNRGAVMRCEADGSNLEVFALGVRNAQELAFDDYGNLFSVDNDGDYPTERERLLYITEGSEHGWRLNWQWVKMQDFATEGQLQPYLPWMDEGMFKPHFEGQPAFITPPLENYSNGPCGFVYNPGTALNESLRNCFFLTEFKPKVAYFRMNVDGASFKKEDVGVIEGGVSNTGLAFGPDGALYSGAWMKGYAVLPEGRIFKIDDPKTAGSPVRAETARLLGEGMSNRSIEHLGELLAHADQRVRSKAQFELVKRGEKGQQALQDAALRGEALLKRLHGIWGIGQLARKDARVLKPLMGLLESDEVEVKAQMCRVIGDARFESALGGLLPLLKDESLRVRFLASIAVGALESIDAFDAVVEMIIENDDQDIYLRHAGVMGLAGSSVNDTDRLLGFVAHESQPLRMAAVLALRRHENPEVSAYLRDGDNHVATEAARAIHDDLSIELALLDLAELLSVPGLQGEALIRRAINANLRVGTPECLERIANFAADESAGPLMRRVALTSMVMWEKPGVLDPVEGRYRALEERPESECKALFVKVASAFDVNTDIEVLAHAARMIGKWNIESLEDHLYEWTAYAPDNHDFVWEVLNSLVRLESEKIESLANAAVASSDARLRELGRLALGKAGGLSELDLAKRAIQSGTLREKQEAVGNLAALKSEEADRALSPLLKKLGKGDHTSGLGLELYKASQARVGSEALKGALKAVASGGIDQWTYLENGGDIDKGKALVMGHPIAQCIRCHSLNGTGGNLGPELGEVVNRVDRAFLVESLIDPTASIAAGYGIISGSMKSGAGFAGMLLEETESAFVVQGSDGGKVSYAKNDVAHSAYASSMPSMRDLLSPGEIRDVVAYLSSLKNR